MIKTPNLDLPIYDKPSTDTFKVADWNKANENIDYVFGELKKNPNVNAIDIKAREDIINNHRIVTGQMDNKVNFLEDVSADFETPSNELVDSLNTLKARVDEHIANHPTGGGSGSSHEHSNLATLNKITESKITEWDNKGNFNGDYNSLINKPVIPNSNLVTTPIINNTLTLKTDKYQKTTMVNNTTIVLPTVTSFTEIHLFFSTTTDLTLIFPSVKWQSTPSIKANKTYEVIFTYVDSWLGGVVCYG